MKYCTRWLLAIFIFLAGAVAAESKVRLPSIFSNHMVMQRDAEVPLWGWADPGEKVTVSFAGQEKTATADRTGKWAVKLGATPPSFIPRQLTVTGESSTVTISDVLVGDVWLAAGQSNMAFPLSLANDAAEVLPKANDPWLRFFRVPARTAAEPQPNCLALWEETTPVSAKDFSGVAYFFAREIRHDQKVPVGILQAAFGGTDIETWISLNGLMHYPAVTNTLSRWYKAVADHEKVKANPKLIEDYRKEWERWHAEVAPAYNAKLRQYKADVAAGKEVGPWPQPSRSEPLNPDPMAMTTATLRPRTPTVDFNGMIAPLVPYGIHGIIWYQGENNADRAMEYRELFPCLIQDWRQQWTGNVPFLFVQLPGHGRDDDVAKAGNWALLREAQLKTLESVTNTGMAVTIDVGSPIDIHPADKLDVGQRLALHARKNVYHENIVASGPRYQSFEVEDGKVRIHFTETGSGLKAGQQPWCALGVTPFPRDELIGFSVAGDDQKWFSAKAMIDGDSVVVSGAEVPRPVAVRYGWANSPRCNLYNKEGLPASPFRTDNWEK